MSRRITPGFRLLDFVPVPAGGQRLQRLAHPLHLVVVGEGSSIVGVFLGNGDVLEDQQNYVVGFGSVGVSWKPLKWFAPKIQLDWHSPFYHNSNVTQLARWSAQLGVGGSFALPYQFIFDIGVVEDVVVEASPDVVFHFGLRKRL